MELIKINKSNDGIQTVNARELHTFLGVGRDFNTWVKSRIEKYNFVEGVDFVTDSHSPIPGSGNRGAMVDYHISIDMAKELSMVENNPKGHEARRYFIECEKKLLTLPKMSELQILHAVTGEMCKLSNKVDSIAQSHAELKSEVVELRNTFKAIDYKPVKESKRSSVVTLNPGSESVHNYVENMGLSITKSQAQAIGRSAKALCRKRGIDVVYKKNKESNVTSTPLYPKAIIREAMGRCSGILF